MKIELQEISIREVAEGYEDNAEDGVFGYGGKLNIRPPYQREFVYKDAQRDAVIRTVRANRPLNVMYWAKNEDGTYEVIDGQQRTISVCSYVCGDFSIGFQYFHNLTREEKDQISNYKFMVYICEGTDKEKLEWFETINIAGEKLSPQELRNAIYSGSWLSDAKRYFSKRNCAAYDLAEDYMGGNCIRQDYLETAIKWIANRENKTIEEYMAEHQHDSNANELWLYFNSVIAWVKATFPVYRKEMKGLEWGILYNEFKDGKYDTDALEERISHLMQDEDITKKSGIYKYILDGKEKHLNIRAFTPNMKREAYERQKGFCKVCGNHFDLKEMEGDHITPWHDGGKTISTNCQMLCKECNRRKSGK